jgi:hypothetical protein
LLFSIKLAFGGVYPPASDFRRKIFNTSTNYIGQRPLRVFPKTKLNGKYVCKTLRHLKKYRSNYLKYKVLSNSFCFQKFLKASTFRQRLFSPYVYQKAQLKKGWCPETGSLNKSLFQSGLPDGLLSNQKSLFGQILEGLRMENAGIF